MKRHRLDVFALAAGTFFVVLAIGFLLDGLGTWDVDVTWFAPVVLIALGLAGLLSTLDASVADAIPRPSPRPCREQSVSVDRNRRGGRDRLLRRRR